MSFDLPRHLLFPGQAHEIAFRLIPPGTFWMGSRGHCVEEEPKDLVRITKAFWMAETAVTEAQYRLSGNEIDPVFENGEGFPMESVSWQEAAAYAKWLTAELPSNALPPGFDLACLPTEAEWEYACRAETETDYWSGDGEAALAEVGWYGGNARGELHPVRAKQRPNPFGLHDMHGNVWEWCHDEFVEFAYRRRADSFSDSESKSRADCARSINDPSHPAVTHPYRVLRGGSWNSQAPKCRSASRFLQCEVGMDWPIGFRLCLVCRE